MLTDIVSMKGQCVLLVRRSSSGTLERVLSHRGPSNIHCFSLQCGVNDDYYLEDYNSDDGSDDDNDEACVNNWICIALQNKVQVLKLVLSSDISFSLHSSLFTSETITELELTMFNDLMLPSRIYLPRLKILTIEQVKFSDDQSTNLLFAGCPVLEKLTLKECTWDDVKTVFISIPTLQTLRIFELGEVENNCQVVVFGKSLLTFDYRGELKNDYCLCDLSSLVDSSIVMGDLSLIEEGRQIEVAYRTTKFLRGLSHVRDLYLCHDTFKVLKYTEEFFTHAPVFNNLNFIRVIFGTMNFACGALQKLLQKCPSLATLEFMKGVTLTTSGDEYDWQLDTGPSCFLAKLNTVYIGDFKRTKAEVQVAQILLESTPSLKKIIFDEEEGEDSCSIIISVH